MKKCVVLLLSMVMAATLLAGCGKEPVTAESLLENTRSKLYTSFDMDMTMSLKMTTHVDAGAVGTLSMDAETYLDANMKCDLNTSFTSGEMTMKMMGFSYSVPVTSYMQLDADKATTYSQTEKDGKWYYSVEKDIDYKTLLENAEMLNNIDASLLQNLTLTEPTEEKADYVVTATIAFKDMVDVMGTDMQELIESMGSVSEDLTDYYNSLVYDVTYVFDGESQILKSAKVVLNIGELEENSIVSITDLTMECTYNQWNDVVVEIPAEVIENATELPLGEND